MYTTATVTEINQNDDSRVEVKVAYTGDSKEDKVVMSYYPPDAETLRGQAIDQLVILNDRKALKSVFTLGELDVKTAKTT